MKEKKTNTNPRRGFFFVVGRCQSNAVTELVEVPALRRRLYKYPHAPSTPVVGCFCFRLPKSRRKCSVICGEFF